MANGTHTLDVWGDFACFTRPEMKVEIFSYPVIKGLLKFLFPLVACLKMTVFVNNGRGRNPHGEAQKRFPKRRRLVCL
jgi:hypothetical protein